MARVKPSSHNVHWRAVIIFVMTVRIGSWACDFYAGQVMRLMMY